MPKIKITEVDNTGALQLGENANSVFILGPATAADVKPALFTTASAFESVEGYSRTYGDDDRDSVSWYVADRLLRLGMQVVYQAVGSEGEIDISDVGDKTRFDIRFIFLGDYADDENAKDLYKKAWEIAAKRGDCVALLDIPSDYASLSIGAEYKDKVSDYVGKVRTYIESITAPATASTANVNSFASAFVPWIKCDFGNGQISIPGSAGYLLAFAHSVAYNPVWYAAAGVDRGNIPELIGVDYELSNAEVEALQSRAKTGEVELDGDGDNVGQAINSISYVNPYGYCVWGNRTLTNNAAGETLKASAFLNVRVLCTEIAKTAFRAARRYAFEQNNNVLWTKFKAEITPLLDRMQSGNGINGYSIARLATENRGRVKARITIIPVEAVEDFDIEIYMEDSIAEVSE